MKPSLVVLAAGMGSRYGGLKQLAEVGPDGETLLEYAVYDAIRAGFGKVVFVIQESFHRDFEAVIVKRLRGQVPVELVFQELPQVPSGCRVPEGREKPWGTGHAVLVTRPLVREPFAVINADDYYGRSAFIRSVQYVEQMTTANWPVHFGLVAFALGRTLSPHGAVSRGLCELDAKGFLATVTERTQIVSTPEGPLARGFHGDERLAPETPVSMNFFVFTPAIYPFLENQFRQFLERADLSPKDEFYLPAAVAVMIRRGQAKVEVMHSEDPWMGVTYPEDREFVVARFRKLVEEGFYPRPLW